MGAMQGQEFQLIHTKLRPPSPPQWTLPRERVAMRLCEAADYRLTVVQAGAGYGKSTALAGLAGKTLPLAWYQMEKGDTDAQRFLLYLLHAIDRILPGACQQALTLLQQWDHDEKPFQWRSVINLAINELGEGHEPFLLVLDDAHLLNEADDANRMVRHLTNHAPESMHLLAATRYPLNWEELVAMRVRGQALDIGQDELAFTTAEVEELFRDRYGFPLTKRQGQLLVDKSDGWPMILPLVWQRLRLGSATSIGQALEQLSGSTGDLFNYLAQEIWNELQPKVQDFLRQTAVLDVLTSEICDCVRQQSDSKEMLAYLRENGFFIFGMDAGSMRYHHLFRDLLRQMLDPQEATVLHRRAARCYASVAKGAERAIEHFLAAGATAEAAQLLVAHGSLLLANGRLNTLQNWINGIPASVLSQYPALWIYLGDIARLTSRFEEALAWYQEAEKHCRTTRDWACLGKTLRGQARVYLDTVNPARAEALLLEAVRVSDGQEDRQTEARLLDLLAENRLNQGRTAEAEALRNRALALREQDREEAAIPFRLLLRTGRLAEARRLLEASAAEETKHPVNTPRAHRETLLLLALVLAFMGEQEEALAAAVAGTRRGQELASPFVTAVGWMRQGHAWLLLKELSGYEKAEQAFLEAITISDRLQASRLKVEAYWGLCQAYGFRGLLQKALEQGRQGINLAEQAGDAWVAACMRITLGAACWLAGEFESATSWLNQARVTFRECNDSHGQTVTRLWQCLLWQTTGEDLRLEHELPQLMNLVQTNGFEFLFTRRTLLGPEDPRQLLPLLLKARQENATAAYAAHLLRQMGLEKLEFHPGYELRVRTLGSFELWRGRESVGGKAWQRKKARQLFLLLLTYHSTMLHRQQIVETLWPDLSVKTGARDFKIAYNALVSVLEPDRARNAPSAYIERDGSRYGLRQAADLWFDVAEFDRLIVKGDRQLAKQPAEARKLYQQALALYQGQYLHDFPYEMWATQERTRLLNRYLRTAERLARSYLHEGDWEEAIDVCQTLLDHDNCWEPAYQISIQAYGKMSNRSQALRVYRQCEETLRDELGLAPAEATRALITLE